MHAPMTHCQKVPRIMHYSGHVTDQGQTIAERAQAGMKVPTAATRMCIFMQSRPCRCPGCLFCMLDGAQAHQPSCQSLHRQKLPGPRGRVTCCAGFSWQADVMVTSREDVWSRHQTQSDVIGFDRRRAATLDTQTTSMLGGVAAMSPIRPVSPS